MSGGAWGYQSYRIEETGNAVCSMIDLLAKIEHTLDWGACGDTCYECAKNQTIHALETFFANRNGDETAYSPTEILEGQDATTLCPACAGRKAAA